MVFASKCIVEEKANNNNIQPVVFWLPPNPWKCFHPMLHLLLTWRPTLGNSTKLIRTEVYTNIYLGLFRARESEACTCYMNTRSSGECWMWRASGCAGDEEWLFQHQSYISRIKFHKFCTMALLSINRLVDATFQPGCMMYSSQCVIIGDKNTFGVNATILIPLLHCFPFYYPSSNLISFCYRFMIIWNPSTIVLAKADKVSLPTTLFVHFVTY